MYYECSLTYETDNDDGKRIKVTDIIIIEAENYTHAELLTHTWGEENIGVPYEVSPIIETKIAEIHLDESCERYYLCKALWRYVGINGKPKNAFRIMLIQKDSFLEATNQAIEIMEDNYDDWEILEVKVTKIVDFYTAD